MSAEAGSSSIGRREPFYFSSFVKWGLLLGVGLHLAGFLLFRSRSTPSIDSSSRHVPFVTYLSADQLEQTDALADQSLLLDSAPLFIPSRWSFSQSEQEVRPPADNEQFALFIPEVALLPALAPQGVFATEQLTVAKPVDVLTAIPDPLFDGVGQRALAGDLEKDQSLSTKSQLPFIDVRALDDETMVVRNQLRLPEDWEQPLEVAEPLTFLVIVESFGSLLQSPIIVGGSSDRTTRETIGRWLGNSEEILSLPAGRYHIQIFL